MNEMQQVSRAIEPLMALLAPLLAITLPFLVAALYNAIASTKWAGRIALGPAEHGFDVAMAVALYLLFLG